MSFDIAVRSTSSANNGGSSTHVDVPKPVGLAVGDEIVMILVSSQDQRRINAAPSGFTETDFDNTVGFSSLSIQTKIADAGDVAASTFTFTFNDTGGAQDIRGVGFAISSPNPINPIGPELKARVTGANPSFANGITPPSVNSLLIFIAAHTSGSGMSGYAIANDNPASWTEVYDDSYLAVAWALRSQITATGNSSLTGGNLSYTGVLLNIRPFYQISFAETTTLTEAWALLLGITVAESIGLTENYDITKSRQWVDTDRDNSGTWVDTPRS